MPDSAVQVQILSDLGHINLRGNPQDGGFGHAAESALGQALPVDPNTMTAGAHRIFWLGPDEWLIATENDGAAALLERLNNALSGVHAAVNDVSGGTVAMRVSGAGVRDLLAKGCTLDFHPSVFSVGSCAQSGLAKAGVLLGLTHDTPTFELVVRSSFADYVIRWLHHAGSDCGIEFR